MSVSTNDQKRFLAQIPKLIEIGLSAVFAGLQIGLDDLHELGGDDHRHSLPPNAEFMLEVAQKMAEIDVQKLSVFLEHDVIVVSI